MQKTREEIAVKTHLCKKTFLCLCTILFVIFSVCCLSACRDSNALKEVKYTQDSDQVDYNNDTKYQVPSKNGKASDTKNTKYKAEKSASKQKKSLVDVIYSSKNPESDLPTPKYVYDKNGKYKTEASEAVGSSKKNSDKNQDSSNVTNTSNKNVKDGIDGKTTKDDKKSGSTDGGSGSGNDGKKSQGKNNDDDSDLEVYNTKGDDPKIPSVNTIAACGELAVIVQMIGGGSSTTPLVAADSDLLGGEFSDVFSDEDISSVVRAWKGDGSTDSSLDIDKLVGAKPETILAYASDSFSAKQKKKLAKAGISITVVPRLTSATNIKDTVTIVGKMLSSSNKIASDADTVQRASDYCEYHDALLDEIMDANGGYAAYSKVVYDADASSKPKTYKARKWTLLIDAWDYDASYNGGKGFAGAVKAYSGVGLASVGYTTSPASYYMGVGGVVNNAASIDTDKNHAGEWLPVWQFNAGALNPSEVSWSSSYARNIYNIGKNGFTKTSLTVVGSSIQNLSDNGFGTEKFPLVIVANKKMKKAFSEDSSHGGTEGIYHVFSWQKEDDVSFIGKFVKSQALIATINPDCKISDNVVVNPCGLFSTWTQGSAESFLESAWVASLSEFDTDWGGSVNSKIKEFYKKFYRYDLSSAQLKEILAGCES